MSIPVQRYTRNTVFGDPASPQKWYLRYCAGSHKVVTLEKLARQIETIGALSEEDVVHVAQALFKQLRQVLTEGNHVKISKLGTFYTSLNCEGADEEKKCTVKNIKRVNVRFRVDSPMRLVNDSTATTRGADNNVLFYIKGEKGDPAVDGGTGGGAGTGDDGDEFEDPTINP